MYLLDNQNKQQIQPMHIDQKRMLYNPLLHRDSPHFRHYQDYMFLRSIPHNP
jgi:hypothetical protein